MYGLLIGRLNYHMIDKNNEVDCSPFMAAITWPFLIKVRAHSDTTHTHTHWAVRFKSDIDTSPALFLSLALWLTRWTLSHYIHESIYLFCVSPFFRVLLYVFWFDCIRCVRECNYACQYCYTSWLRARKWMRSNQPNHISAMGIIAHRIRSANSVTEWSIR